MTHSPPPLRFIANDRKNPPPPLRYFPPDKDTLLYHLFLFFEVEKKSQRYTFTIHVFKQSNQIIKRRVRTSIFNNQPWAIASRFQVLGMNLSLNSDNVLKLFLIFFHIGDHFNTATYQIWVINLFLQASISSKYSCDNPWKHLEISRREIQMFTFMYLNFDLTFTDKYNMIGKILWPINVLY